MAAISLTSSLTRDEPTEDGIKGNEPEHKLTLPCTIYAKLIHYVAENSGDS